MRVRARPCVCACVCVDITFHAVFQGGRVPFNTKLQFTTIRKSDQ